MGAYTLGKPRPVLFNFGGAAGYFQEVDKVADSNFEGLEFTRARQPIDS